MEDRAWRLSLFGDELESIVEFDPLTGHKTGEMKSVKIYANSHYVIPKPTLQQAMNQIKSDLHLRLDQLNKMGRLLEAQRLEHHTSFDPEMMAGSGPCAATQNFSRPMANPRRAGAGNREFEQLQLG